MNLLGNPQNDNSFTIHVAGTNGKGTVSSIIDSIISKDYKTGLLTSPHLKNYTERIKINGNEISQKLFASTYEYISNKIYNIFGIHMQILEIFIITAFMKWLMLSVLTF